MLNIFANETEEVRLSHIMNIKMQLNKDKDEENGIKVKSMISVLILIRGIILVIKIQVLLLVRIWGRFDALGLALNYYNYVPLEEMTE